MIVRIPLEIGAEEFKLGRWHGTLTCSSKQFHGRPVWIGTVTCLSEDVARDEARQMLTWLERQSWMGGDV